MRIFATMAIMLVRSGTVKVVPLSTARRQPRLE
jgi:hypothetical protein